MTRLINLLNLLLAIVLLSSCAATTEQANTVARSGFLNDYSKLQPNPRYPGSSDWINSTAPFNNYNAIIVNPIRVHMSSALIQDGARPDAESLNEVLEYLHSALEREFSKHIRIVKKPGEGVIHYRGAITGITTEGGITSSVTNALPAVFVVRTVSGQNTVRAQLFMEAEYTDSLTGAPLGAIMQSSAGGAPSRDSEGEMQITLDQLKGILDDWANKAATVLGETLAS